MNGFIILSILVGMFLFFYLYSYKTVASEDKKREAIWNRKHKQEQDFKTRMQAKAELRRQKIENFLQRSKEIQRELIRLNKAKEIQ